MRILEQEAIVAEASCRPRESAEEFLRRLGAIGGNDDERNEAIDEMQRFLDAQRKPHFGIEF
ncbi:MAG: hypothetical protein WA793_01405 [Sphingorhabdus sp.]|uniref:hypothetical protein n=1 Tax=Sphingorhabdus sp. TaxID=1902408 RepID=UPI003CB40F7A